MKQVLPKIIAIVGPTAAGKSNYAIKLAKERNGEIISLDSRQMYRGFTIGAGVVPGKMEVINDIKEVWVSEGVPHHLIGIIDPQKTFSLPEVKDVVEKIIAHILEKGKMPILCGGTGLYVSSIIDNYVIPEVAPNEQYRAELEKMTTEELYKELEKKDPDYAARITPSNRRYCIRALEIIASTGNTVTAQQKKGEEKYDTEIIGITRDKDDLEKRIRARVDKQFEEGLIDEVRTLEKMYGWNVPAMAGLGYRQLRPYLEIENDNTISSLEKEKILTSCKEKIVRETKQYAKRQFTWFKRDKRIKWINLTLLSHK